GPRARSVGAGFVVVGRRGSGLVAKSAGVVLARETGLPIVPGTWWARPVLRVGSWDRTLVPLPFSRVVFAFEEPIFVRADATEADISGHRQELTRRLLTARARSQEACATISPGR